MFQAKCAVNAIKLLFRCCRPAKSNALVGWQKLHKNYGKLPWSDLFGPAINLARNGFPVTVDLADAIAQENVTVSDPLFAETYAPNGTKLVEGDVGTFSTK